MTRGLLDDFKRYAARDELNRIVNLVRNDETLQTLGVTDYIVALLTEDDV